MENSPFDRFTKRLATRNFSRRAALRVGAAGLAVTTLPARGTAAQGTPTSTAAAGGMAENNATYFVQTATGGSFRPNPTAGTPVAAATSRAQQAAYLLTLHGHSGETIVFSDRPQRKFGEVQTTQFFKSMGFTPANPPNAALVADTPQKADAVFLLELLESDYDASRRTLTYAANLLHQYPNARGNALAPLAAKAQTTAPAATFESASLFIDDCPDTTIFCFRPDQWLACVSCGTASNQGTCWSWYTLSCNLCSGSPGDACTANVACCSDGQCIGKTTDEYEDQCDGHQG